MIRTASREYGGCHHRFIEPKVGHATIVRSAAETDAAAIQCLLLQLGYTLSEDDVRKRIALLNDRADDSIFVACIEDDVVGVLSFHIFPMFHALGKVGRITAFVVSDAMRGEGVGRELVVAAEDVAWRNGCLRIEVTSGDHRVEAHEFYRNMGYREDERRFVKSRGDLR